MEFLVSHPPQTALAFIVVTAFGLTIGSFLNVVIFRLGAKAAGLQKAEKWSVSFPKHSFCPACNKTLTWKENIPLVSFILQRGQCAGCKAPIPEIYPTVEAASAACALGSWIFAPTVSAAISGFIFLAALIAMGAIDIKTHKIPNKISFTSLGIMLALSFLPGMDWQRAWIGAGCAYLLMTGLVQLGKILFGRKTVVFKVAPEMLWDASGFRMAEPGCPMEESEPTTPEEIFLRKSDRVDLEGSFILTIDGKETETNVAQIQPDGACVPPNTPEPGSTLRGTMKQVTFPREALGMGDAKLMAVAGAALGIGSGATALAIGAICGLIFALAGRVVAKLGRKNPPETIAFGPWIALGSAATMFLIWLGLCA